MGIWSFAEVSWTLTCLHVFLDTDSDCQTGTPISNPLYYGETIGADYGVNVSPVDLWGYIGYTVGLYKPDGSTEGHDNWLNMRFSDPVQANSPAQFLVAVPLSDIDNPKGPIRLYVASSGQGYLHDIAPTNPLSLEGNDWDAPADTDNDDDVDGRDCATFAAGLARDWGSNPGSPADLNGDGIVDEADVKIFAADFGRTDF